MPETPRRSGRSRKANAKYTSDGWDKETLRLLRESSESSNPTSLDEDDEEQQSDEEFDQRRSPTAAANGADEGDDLSMGSGSTRSSQVDTPQQYDEEGLVSEDEVGRVAVQPPKFKPSTQLRVRGIGPVERGTSARSGVWQSMFGPELEDLKPMLIAKERWLYKLRDATLPSLTSIEQARQNEWKPSTSQDNGAADLNTLTQQSTSIELLLSDTQQILHQVSKEEIQLKFLGVPGLDHQIVLGPWTKQKIYKMPHLQPIDVGQAWKVGDDDTHSSYHTGWLINVGEKPLCMAWSPCQDQDYQYLAIACRSTPEQRASIPAKETDTTPAFARSAEYPILIQIWRFATITSSSAQSHMDTVTSPQLSRVLACNIGDVKQLGWAPRSLNAKQSEEEGLGLLTIVSTDGCARLIRILKPESSSTETDCVEVKKPVLKIQPPSDAVFTCFTFASSIDLILGLSSGYIQIYNLATPVDENGTIQPYYDMRLHQTYILALVTMEEENCQFLGSTSASGAIQITDLCNPTQDTFTLPRARLPTRNMVFNSHSRAFLITIDSSGNTEARGNAATAIMAHTSRHFYTGIVVSKFPEGSGTGTALTGSPLHPFVLMGNSAGTVWSQNVVRRIFPTGKAGGRNDGGAWIQKLFEYEWIRKAGPPPSNPDSNTTPTNPPTTATTTNEPATSETTTSAPDSTTTPSQSNPNPTPTTTSSSTSPKTESTLHYGPPTRPGRSRLSQGFRPEKLDLSNTGSKKRKAAAGGPHSDSAAQVIFEEEQAVTSIVWNHNSVAAGWCAVGWGSGVVLVADLGHDAV